MSLPDNEPPKILHRDSRGTSSAGDHMTRFASRPAIAFAQVGAVALCAWVFAGMLDGASPTGIIGIPMLLTGWAAAFALIDRWVIKRNH
jgi:hypothetical protein